MQLLRHLDRSRSGQDRGAKKVDPEARKLKKMLAPADKEVYIQIIENHSTAIERQDQ